MQEEKKRVADYLHASTEEQLNARLEKTLIAAHIEKYQAEFTVLLVGQKFDGSSIESM